jgi:dimethylaniline monooxygenase (N-oxide forming)
MRNRPNQIEPVMVANGHHWDARWPEPPFPGHEAFEGEQLHVHDYKTPERIEGKRVRMPGIAIKGRRR